MKVLITVTNKKECSMLSGVDYDILDIKNPEEGSLGAPAPEIVEEIKNILPANVSISIPVGDVPYLTGTVSFASLGACFFEPDYIKVGLKGPLTPEQALIMLSSVVKTVSSKCKQTKVVAALYGDYKETGTMDPMILPGIASRCGIETCLIDTLQKDGRTLFEHISVEYLKKFVAGCHKAGITACLAGSIRAGHLGNIAESGADIVGVRGGICGGGDRKGLIDTEMAKEFARVAKKIG